MHETIEQAIARIFAERGLRIVNYQAGPVDGSPVLFGYQVIVETEKATTATGRIIVLDRGAQLA